MNVEEIVRQYQEQVESLKKDYKHMKYERDEASEEAKILLDINLKAEAKLVEVEKSLAEVKKEYEARLRTLRERLMEAGAKLVDAREEIAASPYRKAELRDAKDEIERWAGDVYVANNLLIRCASAAGNPDPAEGCRLVIKIVEGRTQCDECGGGGFAEIYATGTKIACPKGCKPRKDT